MVTTVSECEILVIGGGIVGLAMARALLLKREGLKLTLIDKETKLASHQTGHNSGVIHSGIYYKPGSLKARLCLDGARRMVDYAREKSLAYEVCGKLIVATADSELPWLEMLWQRGEANGVPALERVDSGRLRELEPNAAGLAGIYSAATGIIDYGQVANSFAEEVRASGGEILLGARLQSLSRCDGRYRAGLDFEGRAQGELSARFILNCAGLYSDKVAMIAGLDPKVAIVPFRGEYYLLKDEKKHLVKNLLYPVPNPALPFLGVHFTRTVSGIVEAGPNAVMALAREGYSKSNFNLNELASTFSFSGFWPMAYQHWRTGLYEAYRSFSKEAFVRALQHLVPSIEACDLVVGPSGVRAQCLENNGKLVDDFRIIPGDNAMHVLNVPSPAATASLAIADYILPELEKMLES
jgi:L-2-hydroxyglutarate oxidase LhgO